MVVLVGLKLMLVGMTVVFLFLLLLVLAMEGSARFFAHFAEFFPEEKTPTGGLERLGGDDDDIAVVIAAVKAYTRS
jgi:oxaloacetate decarboxylase (Na+ extruding) subunit gamma